ncbi:protein of unknown function [Modestobacter italicus]|uniref:Uncharacterized protein n=1 Tax=Modestobacter italicus (strain DSM 44449 / CECT 9708 / BC 501) TaxID=2732864 RepID=I4EQZ1_MODI5|nr:hypothetical protein [Modestobacter marinus]CCH85804.1 protein of unknown function [Modestobacter marinus]
MHATPYIRPADDDLLRRPAEADLADSIVAILTDPDFGPVAQSAWLELAGGWIAHHYATRVLTRPLVVLQTPSLTTGLDVHLAEETPDGLLDLSAGELKGPGSPGQSGRLSALTDPQLGEAQRQANAFVAAEAAGELVIGAHSGSRCTCSFRTADGGRLRFKETPTRDCPDAISHVVPQLVQIGYGSAAASAVPVPAPWNSCGTDARVRRIHPHVRGLFVPVHAPRGGLLGKYHATADLVWPWRWATAEHPRLLHSWATRAARLQLPEASSEKLREFAARTWMVSSYTATHRWPQTSLELVPALLPETYPCPRRCCAA